VAETPAPVAPFSGLAAEPNGELPSSPTVRRNSLGTTMGWNEVQGAAIEEKNEDGDDEDE